MQWSQDFRKEMLNTKSKLKWRDWEERKRERESDRERENTNNWERERKRERECTSFERCYSSDWAPKIPNLERTPPPSSMSHHLTDVNWCSLICLCGALCVCVCVCVYVCVYLCVCVREWLSVWLCEWVCLFDSIQRGPDVLSRGNSHCRGSIAHWEDSFEEERERERNQKESGIPK